MQNAHLHLILNHFPLVGLLVAVPLLLYAAWRGQEQLCRVALVVTAIAGLMIGPVYLSGEEAEDEVENIAGVEHDAIEEHEESGKFALIFGLLTGATAAAVGVMGMRGKKKVVSRRAMFAVAALGIFTLTVIGRTAYLGGLIRHAEEMADVRP